LGSQGEKSHGTPTSGASSLRLYSNGRDRGQR
jgi:hypothetical protein